MHTDALKITRHCLPWAVALAVAAGARTSAAGSDFFSDEIVKPIEMGRNGGIIIRPPVKPEQKKDEPAKHTLRFHSGAELLGELVELTADAIVWKHPDMDSPVRFSRDQVRQILLGKPPRSGAATIEPAFPGVRLQAEEKPASAPVATVKLPGGDWLHGNLETTDGEMFTLKTKSGAAFSFKRGDLAWIYFDEKPAPAFHFDGDAAALNGWDAGDPATVEDRDGRVLLRSRGWIGRSMTPPPRFEVALEIPEQSADTPTRLWLQPFSPSPNSYSTGTVELSFGKSEMGRLIYVNQFKRETTKLPEGDGKGPARYRVFYDGVGDRVIVLRNGERIGEWPLMEKGDKNEGDFRRNIRRPQGICFDRGFSNTALELGAFSVKPWNGVVPGENDTAAHAEARMTTGKEAPKTGRLESAGVEGVVFGGAKIAEIAGTFIEMAQPPVRGEKFDALLVFGSAGELGASGLQVRDGRAKARTSIAEMDVPLDALDMIFLPPRDAVKPDGGDVLVFRNGDLLRGTLLATKAGEPLRWKMPDGQEVGIKPARAAGVRFAVERAPQAPEGAFVELRNGDRMTAKIAAFDLEAVTLAHGLLGARKVAREKLWSIFPSPAAGVSEAGADPEKWMGMKAGAARGVRLMGARADSKKEEPFQEQFHLDGHFFAKPVRDSYSNALSWTRDGVLDRFEFRVTATDTGGSDPYISMNFAGANGSPSVQVSLNYGQLRIYSYNMRNNRGGFPVQREVSLADKLKENFSRRELRCFVDSKAGTIDVLVDGVPISKFGRQAAERAPGIGAQGSVSCYSSSGERMVLSDIRVEPWNGELPRTDGAGAVYFANGDAAGGKVGAMKDGALLVESEAGPLEVPVERVQAVHFGGAPDPQKAAARLWLTDGTVLHVGDFTWDGGRLTARSGALGEIELRARDVAELILNPTPARFPKSPPPPQTAKRTAHEDAAKDE